MNPGLASSRQWWRALEPRRRRWLTFVVVGLVLLLAAAIWYQLGVELRHWRGKAAQAAAGLRQMQDDIAETRRLRSLPEPAPLSGQALVNVLTSSLQQQGLSLGVSSPETGLVQIRGVAAFDEVILWLGRVQHDHQLRIVSLVTSGANGAVKFEVSLRRGG